MNNTTERLQLYSRLDNIKDDDQLEKFNAEIRDRFGPAPPSVEELINSVRLRWLGERLGFEKLALKGEKLRAYFVSTKDSYFSSDIFGAILAYVQKHPKSCKMKDSSGKAMLLIDPIRTVDSAIELLTQMAGPTVKSSSVILSK